MTLVPLSDIIRISGKCARTIALYKKLGLTSGFRTSRSLGPHRGRQVQYDQDEILAQIKQVDEDLKAGKSLEQQSRERGWHSRGLPGFSGEVELRRVVKKSSIGWSHRDQQQLVRAVDFVARRGLLENSGFTLPWKLTFEGDEVVVRFHSPSAVRDFARMIREFGNAMKAGTPDTVVTLAEIRQELRDLNSMDPSMPNEIPNRDLTSREKKIRRRETEWRAARYQELELKAQHCLKYGTGFPPPGTRSTTTRAAEAAAT